MFECAYGRMGLCVFENNTNEQNSNYFMTSEAAKRAKMKFIRFRSVLSYIMCRVCAPDDFVENRKHFNLQSFQSVILTSRIIIKMNGYKYAFLLLFSVYFVYFVKFLCVLCCLTWNVMDRIDYILYLFFIRQRPFRRKKIKKKINVYLLHSIN